MSKEKIPNGVWPVMLTPFNDDLTIDYNAYERLIEFYIEHGISGLFACCGSSEVEKLSISEMLEIIEFTIRRVNGRVPVAGGAILFDDISKQIDLVKNIYDAGVDAVILAANQFSLKQDSSETWISRFGQILDQTGEIPLGTYELPTPWHRLISADEFQWMASSGRFVFHKDTSCSLSALREKIEITAAGGPKVFTAHSPSLLEALRLGANGYCGTGANFVPELYSWLCANFEKEPEMAEEIQRKLADFERRFDTCDKNYPANSKAFLNLRGIQMKPLCRLQVPAVTQEHIKILSAVMSDFKKLRVVAMAAE
jgi:4-hydroxy-tetrahydrodipicolinate synthase